MWKMNILIIHHVEPMWKAAFDKDEYEYIDDIVKHLMHNSYDEIIMTTLEGDSYNELEACCDIHEHWSYGWEDPEDPESAEWYGNNGIEQKDIIPASGHAFAYVYPWIKKLKGNNITICGGAQYECLADLRDTLEHVGIEYKDEWDLIYG